MTLARDMPRRQAAALLILAALATPAGAHALLRKAVPAVGASLHAAPDSVTLRFSESVEPAFSSIAVTDAAGARFDSGAARAGAEGGATLTVPLRKLPAGVYTVRWHATSVDTHKTEGAFTFTVAP